MHEVLGGFFFRNEGDGCLTSKYVNNNSQPFVEAAKAIDPCANQFCGKYHTVWLEGEPYSQHSVPAILTISQTQLGKYDLKWEVNEQVKFRGVGMLAGELLIGGYWSV